MNDGGENKQCGPGLGELVHSRAEGRMIFVWRGWGPIGLVALILPVGSCAGLVDWNPLAAITVFGFTLFAGGLSCRHYGRKWNQGSGTHMMYGVPLEYWGWAYMIFGGFFGVSGAVALVRKAVIG